MHFIVLDRDALKNLRDDIRPATLPRERRRLWKEITGVTRLALRVEDFLEEQNLLPVYQEEARADPKFHTACRRVTDDLVTRLIQRRTQTRSELPIRVEQPSHNIVIGAVPERLAAARDALARLLGNTRVKLIKDTDLENPLSIRRAIEGAGVMLQPFDGGYPIGWSQFAPGGHLAYQRQLFKEAQTSGRVSLDAKLIWWEPEDTPAADKPLDARHRTFLDEIEDLPEEFAIRSDTENARPRA